MFNQTSIDRTLDLISHDPAIGSDKIMAKARRRRRRLGIEGGAATKVREYLRAFGLDDPIEISHRLRGVSPGMIRLMLKRRDVRAVLRQRRNRKPR